MSRIGLVDVDNTSFPNLALGKIARHHKAMGDSVEWVDPLFGGGFTLPTMTISRMSLQRIMPEWCLMRVRY